VKETGKMSRRAHPFEDTPPKVGVHLEIPCDYLLVEWLPMLFGQSEAWVQNHILYPCDSKTKAPLKDPKTGEILLGPPVAQFGNKRVIVREDLVRWIQRHAQPLVRSTWRPTNDEEEDAD
jgi:hypothetical protein